MDNLKWVLSRRSDPSPQVQQLLSCLETAGCGLDVYICSVGGVGSTELSNFLTRSGVRCNLLTDQDSMRHINRPPELPHVLLAASGRTKPSSVSQSTQSCRVVYLFGDPLASVCSHYRRGIARQQALKTSGNPALRQDEFPVTFEDFVKAGKDVFGYEEHLRNWLTSTTAYDIMFVRYERMFDLPVALALFHHVCGASKTAGEVSAMAQAFAASFRERQSRISPEQRASMYVDLQQQMDELPHIFLRTPSGHVTPVLDKGLPAA